MIKMMIYLLNLVISKFAMWNNQRVTIQLLGYPILTHTLNMGWFSTENSWVHESTNKIIKKRAKFTINAWQFTKTIKNMEAWLTKYHWKPWQPQIIGSFLALNRLILHAWTSVGINRYVWLWPLFICVCLCIHVYVYINVFLFVCVYIYIFMYIM